MIELAPNGVVVIVGVPGVKTARRGSIMQSKCKTTINEILELIPDRRNTKLFFLWGFHTVEIT
ncbi:UNVERIFIED_CONTAM: hypothetical protein Sradi_0457000 [Sesamum radiatum]|uniref:Uncharacterized protein n=1 Tax=Sesamum radiatum TaxID=300843 RepID=A0AAW2W9S3_SESRA